MKPNRISAAHSKGCRGQTQSASRSTLSNVVLALVLCSGAAHSSILSAQITAQDFSAYAARATAARESGKVREALQDYQVAVKARPDWDEGWWYLGTLNYDADHFSEAIPALKRFVELDANVGAGWAFLGLSEFETKAYDDSFSHLQRAQNLGFAEDPDVEKVAVYHLALLLNRRGAFEESSELLVKTFGASHLPDQIKTALALALLRVPLLPSELDPARDGLLHAVGNVADLLTRQDLDSASHAFQQTLKDFPSTPYLHYAYGLALIAQSQFEQADAQFREESLITPHSAMAQVGLSSLNLKRGRPAEAIANAQSAIKMDPESAEAYQALAQALRVQLSDQAATAAERARQLASQPAKPDPNQAKLYALNHDTEPLQNPGQSNDTEPQSQTTRAARQDFEAVVRQANAARAADQATDAIVLYRRAVELRPSWQEGWRQLGTLFYMQQDYPAAASALKRSVALESKQADTWTLLGLCEFELKDYKNALLHLKNGEALGFGGNPAGVRYARYHLALLLNQQSEFDAATDLLIPEAHSGPLFDEIQFAMGIALLRMPLLPGQVEPAKQELVRMAGQAAVLLSESRYDRAFSIFEKLLQEYQDTPFLHYAYGDALSATSDYDRALVQLRTESRINPKALVVQLRLTAIALRLNEPEVARDSAKTAVSLAPDSPDAHYLLGRSYLESGDVPAAILELETARGLAPGSPAVHFNLARAYAKARRAEEAQKERAEFQRLNSQSSTLPAGQRASQDGSESVTEGGEALAPPIAK
jgi:predicted Zn-dependent protease